MQRFVFLIVFALLAACATPLDPRTIEIPASELNEYWQKDFATTPSVLLPVNAEGGVLSEMLVRYVIDSDGRTRNIEILDFEGARSNLQYMLKEVEVARFKPAPANPDRIPVIIHEKRSFGVAHTVEDLMNMPIPKRRKIESIEILPAQPAAED